MTGWLWRAGASRPRRRKVYDSATMAQAIALVAGPMVNPRCKNQADCSLIGISKSSILETDALAGVTVLSGVGFRSPHNGCQG